MVHLVNVHDTGLSEKTSTGIKNAPCQPDKTLIDFLTSNDEKVKKAFEANCVTVEGQRLVVTVTVFQEYNLFHDGKMPQIADKDGFDGYQTLKEIIQLGMCGEEQ